MNWLSLGTVRRNMNALMTITVLVGALAGNRLTNPTDEVAATQPAPSSNSSVATSDVAQIATTKLAEESRPVIGAGKCVFFAETKRTLCNAFLTYWEHYGGLKIFGYPLSWEMQEDGRWVQYFERAKFEYHPEAIGTDWTVMGELLGNVVTEGRENEAPFQPTSASPPGKVCDFYGETQQSLCGGFRQYWQANGAL